jgi:hypothetical protein
MKKNMNTSNDILFSVISLIQLKREIVISTLDNQALTFAYFQNSNSLPFAFPMTVKDNICT